LTMPLDPNRVEEHRTLPENAGIVYLPTREVLQSDMALYNRTTLAVADSSPGVTSVDTASLFPNDASLFLDVMHYTTEGVVRFGEILARELADRIPIPVDPHDLSAAALRRCDW